KSLQTVKETGVAPGAMVIYNLEGIASLAVCQKNFERARLLYAWADIARGPINDPRPPAEQRDVEKDLATIHAQMDDATFEKLRLEGSKLTLEKAIELALKELD
ncbi:MAG TPA: hypothetical protein VLA72_19610, partial [Anaerolineales bacterium]|nr:hypothetical protein [Anaerolineales bacterium]